MFCFLCEKTHNAKNKTKYFNKIPVGVHADSSQHKLAIQLVREAAESIRVSEVIRWAQGK